MKIKNTVYINIIAIAGALLLISSNCAKNTFKQLVVSGEVATVLSGSKANMNQLYTLVARTTIDGFNINDIPQLEPPSIDSSGNLNLPDLPASLEPVTDASVTIDTISLKHETGGFYMSAPTQLQTLKKYNFHIETPDSTNADGYVYLPGQFSIVSISDTLLSVDSLADINVNWSKSDSASKYLVMVQFVDTSGTVTKYNTTVKDTTCVIPANTFTDENGAGLSGKYLLEIGAVYGGLSASTFTNGSLIGALGMLAGITIAQPAPVIVQ